MYLILFGAPGVGKGTQAEKISAEYKVPQVSTGEMLREAIREESELGKQVKDIISRGELVSDDVILELVENRIQKPDCENGFILDGFPRTQTQAEGLEKIVKKLNLPPFTCVEISVPNETIIERLMSRGRADDSLETVTKRLKVYQDQTEPVKGYYISTNQFVSIDGNKTIDDVYNNIVNIVKY